MIKFKSKLRSVAIIILVHLFRCLLDGNVVYGKIRPLTVRCMGHSLSSVFVHVYIHIKMNNCLFYIIYLSIMHEMSCEFVYLSSSMIRSSATN